MNPVHAHRPPQPAEDVPDEFDPGSPPVEPDEGPDPLEFPGDPQQAPVRAAASEQQAFAELDARIRACLVPGLRGQPPAG